MPVRSQHRRARLVVRSDAARGEQLEEGVRIAAQLVPRRGIVDLQDRIEVLGLNQADRPERCSTASSMRSRPPLMRSLRLVSEAGSIQLSDE